MSTASSSVGKEGLSSSTGDTGSLDQKVEMAQKFDKEMKDYAKATVKEFLGIYGYEEDVDMEESAAEGSAQSERTMSINSASCTAVTPDNSRPPHEVTSNISSVSPSTSTDEKETNQKVTSVSISSSTTKGNADVTRFCITMSIPRNGADSEQGFTTLRFWNCIMCSTAFVGCKPEIVQRIHYPHLFTYQPEWLSHAGICTRCQNALAVRTPKITIYAINEVPQYHHGYTPAPSTVPATQMCHALPGQCNCTAGTHPPIQAAHPVVYPGAIGQASTGVPLDKIKTEPIPAGNEGDVCPQYGGKTDFVFRPITCTQ